MRAAVSMWLAEPPTPELRAAIQRLERTPDVLRIAVMPDAHLAEEVFIGAVIATSRTLFPAAVGGDIGCGMMTLRLGIFADTLEDPERAALVLAGFSRVVPAIAHPTRSFPVLPDELWERPLSSASLESAKKRDGQRTFRTLGRGNHFLEIQRDMEGELWLTVHSGSRGMGPAILRHHEAHAIRDGQSHLHALEAESPEGQAYLEDTAWAARFAALNREAIVLAAVEVLSECLGAAPDMASVIHCDHNHVRREEHGGETYWVHRKGALGLEATELGIIPGSMGQPTFHVEGRGTAEALGSSAHGAGRRMTRTEARRRVPVRTLLAETRGVFFDHRRAEALREEAPSVYKDIGEVMRAQRDLVRVMRRLDPVLVYKGA